MNSLIPQMSPFNWVTLSMLFTLALISTFTKIFFYPDIFFSQTSWNSLYYH